MRFTPTAIPDVIVVEADVFGDERGFFMETWRQTDFAEAGINAEFVQDNHSKSTKGILRGLHYQIPKAQGKLVRVISGDVFDVAIDLRRNSPTFGKWVGEIISSENKKQLWLPPGFAHGFLVMSETAEFVYKCTDYYAPQHERCIVWDDPDLGIEWPQLEQAPVLSQKDIDGISFAKAEYYL